MSFDDEAEQARASRGLGSIRERLVAVDTRHAALMPTLIPVAPAGWRGGQLDAQNAAFARLVNRRNRYVRLVELDAPPIIIDHEEVSLLRSFQSVFKTARRELRARQRPAPRAADTQREAALLAAIRANPSDDSARAVYADFLLSLGDPRGEFISMQLENAAAKRLSKGESELLRRHFEQWMGPLAQAAANDGHVVFRRGFPVSMKVDDKRVGEVIGDPAWATLEHVESGSADLLADPSLRALERVSTNFRTLRQLCSRSQRLEGVRSALLRMRSTPPAGYSTVVESDALVALRELTLLSSGYGAEEDWSWLDGASLTRRLETLTVASSTDHLSTVSLDGWLDFLARHPRLRALSLTFNRKALRLDIVPPSDERAAQMVLQISDRFLEYASLVQETALADQLAEVLLASEARRWSAVRIEATSFWFCDLFAAMLPRLAAHFGETIEMPELPDDDDDGDDGAASGS